MTSWKGGTMAAESHAHARWHGDLTTGAGTIDRVGSGTFGPLEVTWAARTGAASGTCSPEELIAAAHAACFSMALSNVLASAGDAAERGVDVGHGDVRPRTGITTSEIEVEGQVPGIDEAAFRSAAEEAKDACRVSKALHRNVEISVVARSLG
jgi:lipoyl-dependent peroxiredoxin